MGDGWVTLRAATRETLEQLRAADGWPTRPMTIARNATFGSLAGAVEQFSEWQSWGINYVRLAFESLELQTKFATTVLPLMGEAEDALAVRR